MFKGMNDGETPKKLLVLLANFLGKLAEDMKLLSVEDIGKQSTPHNSSSSVNSVQPLLTAQTPPGTLDETTAASVILPSQESHVSAATPSSYSTISINTLSTSNGTSTTEEPPTPKTGLKRLMDHSLSSGPSSKRRLEYGDPLVFPICPRCASRGKKVEITLDPETKRQLQCTQCVKLNGREKFCLRCEGFLQDKTTDTHVSNNCPNKEILRTMCCDKKKRCLVCHENHEFQSACFVILGRCCEFIFCSLKNKQALRTRARKDLGFLDPGLSRKIVSGEEIINQEGTVVTFHKWLLTDSNLQALTLYLLGDILPNNKK